MIEMAEANHNTIEQIMRVAPFDIMQTCLAQALPTKTKNESPEKVQQIK